MSPEAGPTPPRDSLAAGGGGVGGPAGGGQKWWAGRLGFGETLGVSGGEELVAGKRAPTSLLGPEFAAGSWLGLPPTVRNKRQRGKNANDYRLCTRNRISRELAVRGLVMKGNNLVFYFKKSLSNAVGK